MDGGNLLFDLPPQPAPHNGGRRRAPSRSRPQAVRNTLMAFLAEPHTVKEIAVRAGRTTSNVTGHLRAMRRKNLVIRLSWVVWVRRDKCDAPPDQATIRRSNPAQERLLEHLSEPKTLAELVGLTGRRGDTLRTILMKMAKRGQIEQQNDRFTAVSQPPAGSKSKAAR
jgi:predicted transcriptional regulator